MNKDIAIKVENISKKYIIGEKNSYITLRDHIMSLPKKLFSRHKPKEFWALRNISFEVKKGEILGIIGRNGAGKSTLLKILSRITEPTTGLITMKGRVASLLEVGTGFNPELTGRENIYLNGAIIGMKRKEIRQKFEHIVEFSGIEQFIDTPVKRYSSGMYVRLAFAVSAFLESDILIVDEVLAVGDAEFQKKSLGKMNDLANSGRTVIFVSHSLPTIQNICHKAILIENGKIKSIGETQKVINQYIPDPNRENKIERDLTKVKLNRTGNGLIKFTNIAIFSKKNSQAIRSGDDLFIEFQYKVDKKISSKKLAEVIFSFPLINGYNNKFADFNTEITEYKVKNRNRLGKITCKIPKLPLMPGVYSVNAYCAFPGDLCDWIIDAHFFTVLPGRFFESGNMPKVGWLMVDHEWLETT